MSTRNADQRAHILHNKKVHDQVASSYEEIHVEIYNPVEQDRLARQLGSAISKISTGTAPPRVLDFGAGTGNLTSHLLNCGANVLASDVSPEILATLRLNHPSNDRLQLLELNGTDLSNLEDESVDMVATYSVLHHVPDYLAIIKEFQRVVKPGGIIYIDHEAAMHIWDDNGNEDLKAYQRAFDERYAPPLQKRLVRKFFNLFSVPAWQRLLNRTLFGLNPEGDIHVTKADHIEWPKIVSILESQCDVLISEDYLLCRERSAGATIYENYHSRVTDMHMLVCKRR